jgi:hypothetical protein
VNMEKFKFRHLADDEETGGGSLSDKCRITTGPVEVLSQIGSGS